MSWGTTLELEDSFWEHDENTLGTRLPKKNKSTPPFPLKEKMYAPHKCLLSLLIGCMKLLLPKLFVSIFGMGKW
jgi:hypothetical protein